MLNIIARRKVYYRFTADPNNTFAIDASNIKDLRGNYCDPTKVKVIFSPVDSVKLKDWVLVCANGQVESRIINRMLILRIRFKRAALIGKILCVETNHI